MKEYTFHIATNPLGWVFVETSPGVRLLRNDPEIDFDLDREDVQVNKYGVVLFYSEKLARLLLKLEKI